MDAYFTDWLSLLVRWVHFITGVAWIGASFYFNWLENHLERQQQDPAIAGDLWAVHGGGFYYLKKFAVTPPRLPETLHWFKWEAYSTWLSGVALLSIVYYANARAFMIDPSVADISATAAISIGIASMLVSWLIYDGLCRSPLARHGGWLLMVISVLLVLLAWGLSISLSGRAAYIHVGAAIGTIMVANVFRVIIPSQKDLVTALTEDRPPDAAKGKNALMRSRHNNYFTLPVLFIMISNHYPGTFSHPWNWAVLAAIAIIGVAIRHYFNVRHLPGRKVWILVVALLAFGLLAVTLKPGKPPVPDSDTGYPTTAEVLPIVLQRCTVCHAAAPSFAGFAAPPAGLVLESVANIETAADRIYQSSILVPTMPLANLTQMTDQERATLALWYQGLQNTSNP